MTERQPRVKNGQYGADPQAPGHFVKFGAFHFIHRAGGGLRFQCHAAFGAGTGTGLQHLGVHGAGVDRMSWSKHARHWGNTCRCPGQASVAHAVPLV